MASVVSMFAWRRIFCATDGCTFARASRVAVVCRSEWKTMPFFDSGRIQSARLSFGQRRFASSAASSTCPQPGLRQRCSYPSTMPARPRARRSTALRFVSGARGVPSAAGKTHFAGESLMAAWMHGRSGSGIGTVPSSPPLVTSASPDRRTVIVQSRASMSSFWRASSSPRWRPRKNAVAKSGRHSGASAARTRGTSSAATVGRLRFGSLNFGSSSRLTGFGPIHQPTEHRRDGVEAVAVRA